MLPSHYHPDELHEVVDEMRALYRRFAGLGYLVAHAMLNPSEIVVQDGGLVYLRIDAALEDQQWALQDLYDELAALHHTRSPARCDYPRAVPDD